MELPKIRINDFEGPFDLLLHLIKKNQMNIYNVKIHEITNQYLNYLNEMKEMDLEITSEFIVVAATLIEIKSKYLLPKPKMEEENEEANRRRKDGGRSQKLMLFIRGNAMSGAPIIRGMSQFPKPPIIMGITIKKIITNA